MAVVLPTRSREFHAWTARVRVLAKSLGLDVSNLDEAVLRDGFSVGDTPAEFCMGALAAG